MINKFFNYKTTAIAIIFASSLLTGCASIVNGTNQIVSVETRNKGEIVTGATCKLQNGKGVFYVTTPGTVTVHRAYEDLSIKCEKENLPPGLATAKSSTKPMAFGNILVGGVIGAAIDTSSGAAYDYPTLLTVMMGESTQISATANASRAAASPTLASTQTQSASPATSPSPSQQPERQITERALYEHFFNQPRNVLASTDQYPDITFTTTSDGIVTLLVNSGVNSGYNGYGTFKIKDENQVCLIITSGKYRSVKDCYRLFQNGANEYILRSVSDKSFIKYKM